MGVYLTPAGVTIRMGDKAALSVGYRLVEPDGPAQEAAASGAATDEPKGNASRAEWAAYADSLGVEYPEDAKRDDIKAAVEAHVAELATTTEATEGEPEQGEPTGSGSDIW